MIKLTSFFLVLFSSLALLAKDNVIDFEGEIIEGERKRPELYLQLSSSELDVGEILYLRDNFNDYLDTDKRMKPRYFKMSRRAAGTK